MAARAGMLYFCHTVLVTYHPTHPILKVFFIVVVCMLNFVYKNNLMKILKLVTLFLLSFSLAAKLAFNIIFDSNTYVLLILLQFSFTSQRPQNCFGVNFTHIMYHLHLILIHTLKTSKMVLV